MLISTRIFKFIGVTISATLLSLSTISSHAASKDAFTLNVDQAELSVKDNQITVKNKGRTLIQLSGIVFNYEKLNDWQVKAIDKQHINIKGTLPASVDFYRTPIDETPREVTIQISTVNGGFRLHSKQEWGRQITLEFSYLGDHFFGLSAPLQPDNRLSPDLTGASISVDVNSEGAEIRENYASAFSAFYMSSLGYGAFFDTFARGRYDFAINKGNRIHHDTGKLDWYIFPGDNGTEIHRAYFALIGEPKKVPAWSLGPIGWRDQNDGGADEILQDIERLSDMKIPFTSWFVDRPYSDGGHAWSKMNFNEKFANPQEWIKKIREDFNLEFMTWVATSTFGDERFEKHLEGRFSYIDLSHEPSAAAYQKELENKQYKVGVRGHKIDRADEGFPENEDWFDATPIAERRNKYAWLVAKAHHEVLEKYWQDNQVTFMRAAIHRTQPYLSAIWGGDPRTTWDGMQGNFANAMRSSFMGFPVWGTDVGGYQGEGYIPEDLYLRWMQAGSMTGLFEIKLDGAGGDGRDRMPWQYDELFQARFRAICEDRMRLLPYLYSLANTSASNGVLMKPMAYQHLDDANTWNIWDQFYLGDAILVAPVFTAGTQRDIYFPKGQWRNFDKPQEQIKGGKVISYDADFDTLPRFIRENSIYVSGDLFQGNNKRWSEQENVLNIHAFPASKQGSYTFNYLDMNNIKESAITLTSAKKHITLESPALSTKSKLLVYLDKEPKAVKLNGQDTEGQYDSGSQTLTVETDSAIDINLVIEI